MSIKQRRLPSTAPKVSAEQAQAPVAAVQKLTPFSPDFWLANEQAQQQVVEQRYADWQQALGALNALRAMRELAEKQVAGTT